MLTVRVASFEKGGGFQLRDNSRYTGKKVVIGSMVFNIGSDLSLSGT